MSDLGGIGADDLPDGRLIKPGPPRTETQPVVAAIHYPDRPAMLSTNSVAALENGYGCYDSGKDAAPLYRHASSAFVQWRTDAPRHGDPERRQQMG